MGDIMNKDSKIFVAGHKGMVGSSIKRKLEKNGFYNLILKTSKELDLTNQESVDLFFKKERPEYVFLAAAKVGGIGANETYPADFAYINLMIECNIIHYSYKYKVKKLLFLGSSCIYPKMAPQPIKEEFLLSGYLESTNEAYAIAKIAGLKMCEYYNKQYHTNFISVMPTNLYGSNDNYDLDNSHVLPAMIRKFHEAKILNKPFVEIWGTGTPYREFLFVDDLADACIFLMENYNEDTTINVGTGEDITILELAEKVKKIVGFKGSIKLDISKPDGTPRKLLDITKIKNLGWNPKIGIDEGINKAYEDFLTQQ